MTSSPFVSIHGIINRGKNKQFELGRVEITTRSKTDNLMKKKNKNRGVGNSKNTKNGCAFLPLLLCHFWRFSPFFAFFIFRNLASPFPLFLTTSSIFPFASLFVIAFFPFCLFLVELFPFSPKNGKNDEDRKMLC